MRPEETLSAALNSGSCTRWSWHRVEDSSSSIYPLARLWLARTQALAGDAGKARLSYEAFLSAWPEADQDLKPIIDARQELARLK